MLLPGHRSSPAYCGYNVHFSLPKTWARSFGFPLHVHLIDFLSRGVPSILRWRATQSEQTSAKCWSRSLECSRAFRSNFMWPLSPHSAQRWLLTSRGVKPRAKHDKHTRLRPCVSAFVSTVLSKSVAALRSLHARQSQALSFRAQSIHCLAFASKARASFGVRHASHV